MKISKLYLLVFASLLLMTGCTGIYENGKDLANATKNQIEKISADELKDIPDTVEYYLIDVRQADEYAKGNIEGSYSIPRGILEFQMTSSDFWVDEWFYYIPKKDDLIVIYCKSGARGTLAVRSLMKLGYTNVKNLTGGIIAYDPELTSGEHAVETGGGCGG